MKVSELHECLERMKKIYPFKDEDTSINLERNPVKCELAVSINTYDEDNDVEINMMATARYWKLDGSNS